MLNIILLFIQKIDPNYVKNRLHDRQNSFKAAEKEAKMDEPRTMTTELRIEMTGRQTLC